MITEPLVQLLRKLPFSAVVGLLLQLATIVGANSDWEFHSWTLWLGFSVGTVAFFSAMYTLTDSAHDITTAEDGSKAVADALNEKGRAFAALAFILAVLSIPIAVGFALGSAISQ